ncbi:hypothetical protein RHGRI_002892 [Rhododendron griersonianum]|uniref:Uncharacterized protein n=1 Tax=Rhododendron griersonianum TaxID=479676 RepID=A0AAV6LRX3_9ERIC|nr:hypothetical protein RHGRI_002892 [Rhododendron griersonianum]
MFVEVGQVEISPTLVQVLELLGAKNEYLAFAPDTNETRMMIDVLSLKFPLLKVPTAVLCSCSCNSFSFFSDCSAVISMSLISWNHSIVCIRWHMIACVFADQINNCTATDQLDGLFLENVR